MDKQIENLLALRFNKDSLIALATEENGVLMAEGKRYEF